MRALIFALGLAACAPVLPPDRPLTPTEARGIEMLHRLRALAPCDRECACHTEAQPPRRGCPCASLRSAFDNNDPH